MIIEGENLEVLKLLTSAYRERVKWIYIDPPYNTGKDFVYSDHFAEGQKPYWEQTGVTEDGVKVDTHADSDGRFHSNWLSMMHSRLLVARYLLRPTGFIVVSIDDNGMFSIFRELMDEVFRGGEFHRGRWFGTRIGRMTPSSFRSEETMPFTSKINVASRSGADSSCRQ